MFGKVVGLVTVAVLAFYAFKNPKQTGSLLSNIGGIFTKGVAALQGRPTAGKNAVA